MRNGLLFALLSAALLTGGTPLFAQAAPNAETAIIAAGVRHLTEALRRDDGVPEGGIRFDPRVVQSREVRDSAYSGPITAYVLSDSRPDSVTALILTLLGADSGDLENAWVCAPDNPRSCTLRGAAAVFAASDPVVVQDCAEVFVKAMWLSPHTRQPIHAGTFVLTLRRESSGWRTVASRTLVIS